MDKNPKKRKLSSDNEPSFAKNMKPVVPKDTPNTQALHAAVFDTVNQTQQQSLQNDRAVAALARTLQLEVKQEEDVESPSAGILLPMGERLSDCVTVYQHHDLQFSGSIPDTMDSVYGLDPVKQALRDCVAYPLLAPQHYQLSPRLVGKSEGSQMGKRELERVLAIYGQRGSGKMLVVQTFCHENGIVLIVISYAGFVPDRDIRLAYEYAEKCLPCLVVFEECEGYFHPQSSGVAYNVGILQNWLDKVQRSNAPIWTVFISSVIPDLTNVHFAIKTFITHSIWSGELSSADREKAFRAAVNRYLYPGQESPLSDGELAAYVNMSHCCTVGDIVKFVRSVFLYRAKQAGADLSMMEQTDNALVPTMDDFALHLTRPGGVGRDRITDYDPVTYNVAPYTNTIRHERNETAHGF